MPAIQLPAKSFLDHIPVVAGVGVVLEILDPLVEDLAMPFRDRNRLRTCRDSVPQRLQIVNLLVDRQVVETGRRQIVGAHVLGEYSAEVIQMAAACMAAGMRVEEVAELQLAFPTFTEGVGMAAQMVVRALGIRAMPQLWSRLSAPEVDVSPGG